MYTLELDMYQAAAVAALVYLLGKVMVNKFSVLSNYCIPAPVVGGLIFAICHTFLRGFGILTFSFDTTLQTFFMMIFFTTVGFTACFRLLKKGGPQVIVFLLVAITIVVLQDALGASLAALFGLDPRLGLCTGSIPMVGGHGTAGSFGPLMEEMGVTGASAVSIAAATFGLVAGSMIGGPIAHRRIVQYKLHSTEAAVECSATEKDAAFVKTDATLVTNAALFIAVAIGLGTILSTLLSKTGLTFPAYIGAMLAAAIIRNIFDVKKTELPNAEIGILGSVALSLFLSMALMNLKLWQLAALAVPMIAMLLAQTVLMALFAYFVVFNIMGRDYEAAAMTTAFCGFGMGATPNAMANMEAVAKEYGPAPRAFFVVPLVGSLFIDFFNSIIITTFLNFLK